MTNSKTMANGVRMLYEQFQSELNNAMLLTGCKDLKAIGPQVIRPS